MTAITSRTAQSQLVKGSGQGVGTPGRAVGNEHGDLGRIDPAITGNTGKGLGELKGVASSLLGIGRVVRITRNPRVILIQLKILKNTQLTSMSMPTSSGDTMLEDAICKNDGGLSLDQSQITPRRSRVQYCIVNRELSPHRV